MLGRLIMRDDLPMLCCCYAGYRRFSTTIEQMACPRVSETANYLRLFDGHLGTDTAQGLNWASNIRS